MAESISPLAGNPGPVGSLIEIERAINGQSTGQRLIVSQLRAPVS